MFLFIGKGTPLFLPPNKKLVLKGLYRYVRNPMYIGAMLITLGEGLLFQSISLFIYALAVFGVCNFNILILEEPYLANKFGESYAQYRKSVRRWIPRLTPYKVP
jgi:protein-S-isoprenylcysteine O-methyltransferase Ste14